MDPVGRLDSGASLLSSGHAADDREKARLEEACRDFEGIFLADLWKNMMKSARALGDGDKRTYAVLEDLAVEMSSESLSEGEGVGLWKVLYSQLVKALPEAKRS